MAKLKSKSDVVEWYWPDYLDFCMRSQDSEYKEFHTSPTIDGFWQWYITKGPMGVKHRNLYYTKEEVEYV
jgi:hypothetical protein